MDFVTKDILLTIAVPTYNRPLKFERLLGEILPQLTSDTELLIRDDSSNEETAEIVHRLLDGLNVRYKYVHGPKIGLDLAVVFLLEEAKGKYVWWFGDDDNMLPGAVDAVLNAIRSNSNLTFIWANFKINGHPQPVGKGKGGLVSREEIIDIASTSIGLISTSIMRRASALKYVQLAKENAVGFGYACLIPVFGSISEEGTCFFLKEPYILNNPTSIEEIIAATTKNGSIQNNGFNVYGVIFCKIVRLFDDKLGRKVTRHIIGRSLSPLWRGMVVGYAGGWDTPAGKRLQMLKLYWSFPEFWVGIIPLLLPRFAVEILYSFYKFWRNLLRSN